MNEDEIVALLASMGIPVSGAIIEDVDRPCHFFVPVTVSRDSDNKQRPSNILLNTARVEIGKADAHVEFLIADERNYDIEAGLRATVLHKFGDHIRNVFVSTNDQNPHVWLETKRALDEESLQPIRDRVIFYLAQLDISPVSIRPTSGENLPSVFVCMRGIRRLAPVQLSVLKDSLVQSGFTIPSDDWLKRRLELMRKDGKIVWLAGNKYALSMESIRSLGTTKDRSSPDITRLLALARRIE
ncbi:hypothetical protein VVD49_07335 [Uliginosibacterium sp. H3]|uniref:DUF1828 domain-containing protein n=1 Tax=Uliginosibacterium silvisoli TaxID=3114758 RepID=A0ABU6K1I1_9RHOO|nr:hypothetical protein [Uliginosibacterium sp. H3]